MASLMSNPAARSEEGRRKNPNLAIFVAEDEPAEPFARLLGAPLPVKNRHVFAAADDAEIVGLFGQVPGEFAVCELVIHHDLIHGERQGLGEPLDELSVLAFVGALEELAPQGIGYD